MISPLLTHADAPNLAHLQPLIRAVAAAGTRAVVAAIQHEEPPVADIFAAVEAATAIAEVALADREILTASDRAALADYAKAVRGAHAAFVRGPMAAGATPDAQQDAQVIGQLMAKRTAPMLEAAATLSALAAAAD